MSGRKKSKDMNRLSKQLSKCIVDHRPLKADTLRCLDLF